MSGPCHSSSVPSWDSTRSVFVIVVGVVVVVVVVFVVVVVVFLVVIDLLCKCMLKGLSLVI